MVNLGPQYGQATETLQGSLANDPRPWVYRNIFQAYGTSIVKPDPTGKLNILDTYATWRRDWSSIPFFLTNTPNAFDKAQTTATLGLLWWWGTKQGAW